MTALRWFSRLSIDGVTKWRYMENNNGTAQEVPVSTYYNRLYKLQEDKQPDELRKVREDAEKSFQSHARGKARETELRSHIKAAIRQRKADWVRVMRAVDLDCDDDDDDEG